MSQQLMNPDIDQNIISSSKYLYLTGYLWDTESQKKSVLNALDEGHIGGAALDVFETEPLPETHLFWQHPNVTVTPHAASLTNPVTAVQFVAENIRRHQNGKRLKHTVVPTDRR